MSIAHQFKLFRKGIDDPKTTRLIPAQATAPWHIAHGSAVVYSDEMSPIWNVLDLTPQGRGDFHTSLDY